MAKGIYKNKEDEQMLEDLAKKHGWETLTKDYKSKMFFDHDLHAKEFNEREKVLKEMSEEKYKQTSGKPRITLVPPQIITDIAKTREYGVNNKYPDIQGWRKVEVEKYMDALLRHVLLLWKEPFGLDAESGLPHLWHISTNLAFMHELMHDRLEEELENAKAKSCTLPNAEEMKEWEEEMACAFAELVREFDKRCL